jgi:hypothetical protein
MTEERRQIPQSHFSLVAQFAIFIAIGATKIAVLGDLHHELQRPALWFSCHDTLAN